MTLNHNTIYLKRYVITEGDLVRGWTFYGPFETFDKARLWSLDNLHVGSACKVVEMSDVRDGS